MAETDQRSEGTRQRVFVGDVQGCAEELEDLLAALDYDPGRHELWFVGDLVNRGPASARVLRRVRALGAGAILGNHDLHLLGVAGGDRPPRGSDTISDVLSAPDREELLAWLRARPLIRIWDDVILVHAGLHPRWKDPADIARPLERAIAKDAIPWENADLRFLTAVRYCNARGERPADDRNPGPGYAPWDHFYRGERRVVCGHWSRRGLYRRGNVRGIDTGCVWGFSLSAWIAEEDRVVSVPARASYQTPA